jgi:hypothetical protein
MAGKGPAGAQLCLGLLFSSFFPSLGSILSVALPCCHPLFDLTPPLRRNPIERYRGKVTYHLDDYAVSVVVVVVVEVSRSRR